MRQIVEICTNIGMKFIPLPFRNAEDALIGARILIGVDNKQVLYNRKCWWLLYLVVLKISQFSKDLIWRYYWKKVGGVNIFFHLVYKNLLIREFHQINLRQ